MHIATKRVCCPSLVLRVSRPRVRYTITARWILSVKCLNGAALLASYDVPLARVCLGAANADGFTVAATSMSPQRHATTRMYRSHTSPFEYGQSADQESSMDLPALRLLYASAQRSSLSVHKASASWRGNSNVNCPGLPVFYCIRVAKQAESVFAAVQLMLPIAAHHHYSSTLCVSRAWLGRPAQLQRQRAHRANACLYASSDGELDLLLHCGSTATRQARVGVDAATARSWSSRLCDRLATPLCEAKTCSRAARHDATSSRPLHPACHQRQRARRHSACQLCCTAAWTASVLVVRS